MTGDGLVHTQWGPRPGWRPGRLTYSWYLTFPDQPALLRFAHAYQEPLAAFPGLNLVPARWLHITVQPVGYADEISDRTAYEVTTAVAERLKTVEPFTMVFDKPRVMRTMVATIPRDTHAPQLLWQAVRAGIADVLGAGAVPTESNQREGFTPHLTLAYANTTAPVQPYVDALANVVTEPVTIQVSDIELVQVDRVLKPEWVYRWKPGQSVRIG